MFSTEAAGADNRSYKSSPSHNFLTSVDNALRADNLSPSSSQGSPARSENHLTEIKPPCPSGSDSALTELKALRNHTANISAPEFPFVSGTSSSFSSIKSDSSSPTYYNSLVTSVSQTPANFSLYTPTATSSTYYSTVTTPTSAIPSYYSSLDMMTTPTSKSPSYYSSLNGMTTPTSTSPSYYSSLNGMTTPYTDYTQYTTPTHVNHPSLTPTSHTNSSPIINSPFSQYKCRSDSSSLSQYTSNEGTRTLSQNVIVTDSSPLYRPDGKSHVSTHRQHSALTNYPHHQNTSPIADYNPTSSVYTAPKPRSVCTVPNPRSVSVKHSSLQKIEEERSVSRARKQRTIFTEKQVR